MRCQHGLCILWPVGLPYDFEELDEVDMVDVEPIDGWIVIGDFEMLTPENMSFQAGGHVSEILWLQNTGEYLLEGEIQGSLDVGRRGTQLGTIRNQRPVFLSGHPRNRRLARG